MLKAQSKTNNRHMVEKELNAIINDLRTLSPQEDGPIGLSIAFTQFKSKTTVSIACIISNKVIEEAEHKTLNNAYIALTHAVAGTEEPPF